ncbi:AraC family transcriptional regulator [Algiphilus sp.]|uniref:AraC family transcriptional regulator n=1 Tax=Algiphilus sp. TaxID=1872431 RepID=UPI0025BCD685|nr:AraC family transcriptional regulator [Algiphilus sp.]MCK5769258.1 AraC family transcriptional regulator [Algiphilus sp.]
MASAPPGTLPLSGSFWSDIRLAYGLLPVVTLLERRGIEVAPLLAAAGIDRFGLMDPSYTIAIDRELDLMHGVIRALGDPEASLDLAREYRVTGFSVLGLAMLACDTPLQILRLMLRYPRLAWGVVDCEIRQRRGDIEIDLRAPPRVGAAEPFLAERDLACAFVIIEEVQTAPLRVRHVQFRHDCRGDPDTYDAFFGCAVSFGAECNRVVIPAEVLNQPMPHANTALRTFYEAQCARMSRDLEQPFRFADAVRSRLERSAVVPDLGALAAAFYMTPRTLQRRLAAEGVSFTDLLRRVREQRAEQLLTETTRGMDSIAAELGFGDAVAFSHAYKRWAGEAPQQRRRRAGAVPVD